MQRLDQLAEDAVHDLSRAQVLAAGREYVQTRTRLSPPFDRWLYDREFDRLAAAYMDVAA